MLMQPRPSADTSNSPNFLFFIALVPWCGDGLAALDSGRAGSEFEHETPTATAANASDALARKSRRLRDTGPAVSGERTSSFVLMAQLRMMTPASVIGR